MSDRISQIVSMNRQTEEADPILREALAALADLITRFQRGFTMPTSITLVMRLHDGKQSHVILSDDADWQAVIECVRRHTTSNKRTDLDS